jgi:hypothetical protein
MDSTAADEVATTPVVGLSLELGTTIINHVVPGTLALARLRSKLPQNSHILQHGHVVCRVDGNAMHAASFFSSLYCCMYVLL